MSSNIAKISSIYQDVKGLIIIFNWKGKKKFTLLL